MRAAITHPILTAKLEAPEVYRAALSLLRARQAEGGELAQAGLELDELSESAEVELARLLARRVGAGEYVFSPVVEREAYLGGKLRKVYRAPLSDTVVLFALAPVLTGLVAPAVSTRVYSYQKGRSSRDAVRDLARFVKAHRAAEPRASGRGLHVLRRDVKGYGDRIPVDEDSPLWPLLARTLEAAGLAASDPFHALLRRALRPEVVRLDGTLETVTRGVPMGSPLQPSICNLYLDSLDRALAALAGGFYARFGDDILFAHPAEASARAAHDHVERLLPALGLALNPEKTLDLFWNGAGRPPHGGVSVRARGTTHVEYLGARLRFDGAVSLSRRKVRRIQSELGERVRASERLLRDAPLDVRVRALTGAVDRALDPRSESALALANEFFLYCDDRRLLGELDHWLSRLVAEALSGRRGERAFRSAPPRWLRAQGLLSLVHRRERALRVAPPEPAA